MAEFLAEFYLSPSDREAAQVGADRARLAAEELALRGTPVRYLSSIFLPEDETCFHLYEACSRRSRTERSDPHDRGTVRRDQALQQERLPQAHGSRSGSAGAVRRRRGG